MKHLLRRHRITALAFTLIVAVMIGMGYRGVIADNAPTPPTQVIVTKAVVTDQGVEINWIAAQPGTDPIGDYVIQKRGQNGDFTQIDQVGADALSYIDASGQAGDTYRVIAEDDQDPANSSTPSDLAVAATQEPGSSIAVVSPDAAPAPDSVSSPLSSPAPGTSSAPSQDTVAPLQANVTQNVAALGSAVSKNDVAKTQGILNSLQGYHQQILTSFPRLTAAQKQSFAQGCQQQLLTLETDVYLLPESSLPDGLLVLSGCDAIQELSP